MGPVLAETASRTLHQRICDPVTERNEVQLSVVRELEGSLTWHMLSPDVLLRPLRGGWDFCTEIKREESTQHTLHDTVLA